MTERARIADFGHANRLGELDGKLADVRRDFIRIWLDDHCTGEPVTPCIVCDRKDPPGADDARRGYRWSATTPRVWFRPCRQCSKNEPHPYLPKFSRDWLVTVMLDNFGGDISRVPTLDELKGLL